MKSHRYLARWLTLLGLVLACATAASQPVPSPAPKNRTPIPFKQDESSTGQLAARSLGGVLLAAGIAYAAALGLKRLSLGPKSILGKARAIRPTATIRLSKSSTLHLVEYHGEELLLADSVHGIQVLRTHPLAITPDARKDEQSDA